MFISKINTNYLMNKPHQKASGFGRSQKSKDYSGEQNSLTDNKFVNMSDKDLYKAASILPNEKFNKIRNNVAGTLFVGVPVLDTIAHGILQNGALSAKFKQMAKRSGFWGFAFATGASLNLLKQKVNKHSIVLENIDQNHPFMRLAMDSTFIVGVLSAGVALKNKTDLFINKNFKDKIKAIKTPIKKVLNNNILNKKVIAPVNNAVNKIAKGNRAVLNIAATFVAPTIATAAILRYTAEGKARKQNIEENFSTLKSFQTALKEYDRKNI